MGFTYHPFDDPEFRSEAARRLQEAPETLLPPHSFPPDRWRPLSAAEGQLRQAGLWPLSRDADFLELDPCDPPVRLPDQVETARDLICSGAGEVEVRQKIAEIYGKKAQPRKAYERAFNLVIEEQRQRADYLPELVMAVRWKAIQGAMAGGSWAAVGAMLRDAGAVAGEREQDRLGDNQSNLTITVEAESAGPAERSEVGQESERSE